MIKKLTFLVLLTCFLTSCKTDQQIDAAAEQLAEESFQELQLTSVDRYPLFENCDEMINNSDCFYRELHTLIAGKLKGHIYNYKWTTGDSLIAAITVKSDGQLQYDSIVSAAVNIDKKRLDSIFREQLNPLCKIEPAIVQGVPVSTSYSLPIKFKIRTTSD